MHQINLYLEMYRPPKVHFSLRQMGTAALGVLLLLALLSYLMWHTTSELELQQQQLQAEIDAKKARNADMARKFPPKQSNPQYATDLQQQRQMVAYRQQLLRALQQHTEEPLRHPYSEYLAALARQDMESVWLTNIAISSGSQSIQLEGMALNAADIPRYIQKLNQEKSYRGTSFGSVTMQKVELPQEKGSESTLPKTEVVSFKMVTTPVQAATTASTGRNGGGDPDPAEVLNRLSRIAAVHSGSPSQKILSGE